MTEPAVPDESAHHCRDMVARLDRDRALVLRLAPADHADALAAIFAFNLEIARVREAVSEAMLGDIRLQWWRDALGEVEAGTPRRHPVVQALARARMAGSLPDLAPLHAAIDARARDLDPAPFVSDEEREAYLRATSGGVLIAAGAALGAQDGATIELLQELGLAHGLVGMLRALPVLVALRRPVFSAPGMADHAVRPDDLAGAPAGPGVRALARATALLAEQALGRARALHRPMDRRATPVLALGAVTRAALGRLRRMTWDPHALAFREGAGGSPVPVTLRLLTGRWF